MCEKCQYFEFKGKSRCHTVSAKATVEARRPPSHGHRRSETVLDKVHCTHSPPIAVTI